jgi:hypothetical protein
MLPVGSQSAERDEEKVIILFYLENDFNQTMN